MGMVVQMSKYEAYPAYKDSGVEWLGEIPSEWGKIRYNFVINENSKSKILVSDAKEYPGQFEFFTSGEGVLTYKEYIVGGKNIYMATGGKSNIKYFDGYAAYSTDTYVFFTTKTSLKYLYYHLCRDNKVINDVFFTGMGLRHLDKHGFKKMYFSLPPIKEQRTIANYLDKATAKIDTFIAKQTKLIELLKEKRQAVISTAVTRGLDNTVAMKDSRIDWLGEIPEHWRTVSFKYNLTFITSGSRGWSDYYSDEGAIFFRITNLTRNGINPKLESIKRVQPPKGSEGERSRIKLGDILISITADLGSVAVADQSVKNAYVSQHVALARPTKDIGSSRWLGYTMIADSVKEQFKSSGYGGTKIQLSLEDVREVKLAIPPIPEREKIANYLDAQTIKIDTLIEKNNKIIILLKERRTALISAAVTGKIDVRGEVV